MHLHWSLQHQEIIPVPFFVQEGRKAVARWSLAWKVTVTCALKLVLTATLPLSCTS